MAGTVSKSRKRNSNISEFEKSLKAIRSVVKKDKSFVEKPITTGYSYFRGNTRLLKLVNNVEEVVIEINVDLPENIANLPGMKYYTKEQAYNMHLGTVKYIYTSNDATNVKEIVQAAFEQFKQEVAK